MYKLFFRLVFQRMDPEKAHYLAFRWIRLAVRIPVLRTFVAAALAPRHEELRTQAFGLRMHGPFGLAAGFDKNAVAIDGMTMLGFDHVEIGTVTGEPQPGNPKKRLFRLVRDRALINRMGFNNEGSLAVAARLASRTPVFRTVVGVNIGKTKVVPEEEAVLDYVKSTERLAAYADYLVVNVSSPNTPGLRSLQAVDQLRPLLSAVREAADRTVTSRRVPLLVKIAPDLADEDVDAVADLAVELGLDGIIATNTTIARDGLGLTSEAGLVKETGAVRSTPEGTLPGGAAAPLRARGRPDHPRGCRRHRERRGRLAAHPGGRHPRAGIQRLRLRGPLLGPSHPQGTRRTPADEPVRHPRRRGRRRREEDGMTLEPFGARLRRAMDERGPLCVGIDPHAALLTEWGLNDDVAGLERFSRTVVEAMADRVAVLKPQSAFFERFGSRGVAVLEKSVAEARQAGALVVMDAKRGDIGSTMAAYAESFLHKDAPLFSDALTVSPYLGYGSLQPAVELAKESGTGLFVLALTSNPEGGEVQHAVRADGRNVGATMLAHLAAENAGRGPWAPSGRSWAPRSAICPRTTSPSTVRCWRPGSVRRVPLRQIFPAFSARPCATSCRTSAEVCCGTVPTWSLCVSPRTASRRRSGPWWRPPEAPR